MNTHAILDQDSFWCFKTHPFLKDLYLLSGLVVSLGTNSSWDELHLYIYLPDEILVVQVLDAKDPFNYEVFIMWYILLPVPHTVF